MKTYISLSDQILPMVVKYGIEGGDHIIIIQPEGEEPAVQAIKDLSRQIDSSIEVDIHRVNHIDFEGMVVSLIDLLKKADGQIVVSLSGGPREIFLAFVVACLSQSQKIFKTTNFSDIDRTMNEIVLPNITHILDERLRKVLKDVYENQPTTIRDIAQRLNISESSASRQVHDLAELKALDLTPKGKIKKVRITLTGKILL